MKNIEFLLKECAKYPDLYNKVSNVLWAQFEIQGAEICLLVTYVIHLFMEEIDK